MLFKTFSYVVLSVLLLSSCIHAHYQVVSTGHEGQPLPSINLISVDSTKHLNVKGIPPGQPIVFLFFRPNCPFCLSEITDITQHANSFTAAHLIFLAANASDTLNSLYKKLQQQHIPNLFIGIDYKAEFHDYFNLTGVPYTAIYSRKGVLRKAYLGQLSSKDLSTYLENKFIN